MNYTAFVAGDRVEVVRKPSKYRRVPAGATGTVSNVYSPNSIRVRLDDFENHTSQYGEFYFSAKELKNINNESNNEGSTIMTGNYRAAEVQFIEGNNTDRTYTYACYDPSVVEGDICVVKSAHHGLGIARVVSFIFTTEELTREIVCKCDFSDYNKRVKNRKRMMELKDLMNARAKQLQDIALFQMLAKDDFEMAALLNEFNILMGGESDGR
jgi:hypothetical protein